MNPLKFTVKVQKKTVRVWVFDTLYQLRKERAKCGRGGSRIYAFVSRDERGGDRVCFARKYTGSNTVAHESAHLAFNIAGNWRDKTFSEEKLAIATGNAAGAITAAFYEHGVYRKG